MPTTFKFYKGGVDYKSLGKPIENPVTDNNAVAIHTSRLLDRMEIDEDKVAIYRHVDNGWIVLVPDDLKKEFDTHVLMLQEGFEIADLHSATDIQSDSDASSMDEEQDQE